MYLDESRSMKPIEIILTRGRGMRETNGEGKPNQGTWNYMELWKCHNETLLYN
jgi:hypothetical protein